MGRGKRSGWIESGRGRGKGRGMKKTPTCFAQSTQEKGRKKAMRKEFDTGLDIYFTR